MASKKAPKNDKEIKIEDQLNEYKNKYLSAIAELSNLSKQHSKEYANLVKFSGFDLASDLLPSFEMFSSVLENKDNYPDEVKAYIMGFDMIYRQMVAAFNKNGISEIEAKIGDEFDHNIHLAMETQDIDDKENDNKIIKIIAKGYKMHDRLIKPVSVIVGKYNEKEN